MEKTLRIDEKVLRDAKEACGASTDTETVRLGLEVLIRQAAYQRLRTFLGSETRGCRHSAPPRTNPPEEIGCLMVLVDTSVWVPALANRSPYKAELDRLLDREQVAGHELIYGELLIGDPNGRERFLKSYGLMRQLSGVPHAEVVAFVRAR
jgi:hypothetical protein